MMSIAVAGSPLCPLMTRPCTRGTLADEVLYGMNLEILEVQGTWRRVSTPYRYEGWAPARCLELGLLASAWAALPKRMVLHKNFCDVLVRPQYQSPCLITLPLGAAVAPMGEPEEGWQRVTLADGGEGYVRSSWLGPYPGAPTPLSEDALRRRLTQAARRYLYAPYRWGGKTPQGIDCSGLVSMAYLLNGIAIWRDAAIKEGFPIRPVSKEEIGPGDLLYFPGHVAMYLGGGEYIHATGKAGSDGVRLNSLDPAQPHYRADLAESLTAVGSYF